MALGIRHSACAGAVKSSWVMPGKSRKTILVVLSVMRMVLRCRGSPRRAARIGPVPRWNSIFSASRGTTSFYPSHRGEDSLFGRIDPWTFVGRAVEAFAHPGGLVQRLRPADGNPPP